MQRGMGRARAAATIQKGFRVLGLLWVQMAPADCVQERATRWESHIRWQLSREARLCMWLLRGLGLP